MAQQQQPPDPGREQSPAFNVSLPSALVSGAGSQRQPQPAPRRLMTGQNSHVFNVPKSGRPRSEHHGARGVASKPPARPEVPQTGAFSLTASGGAGLVSTQPQVASTSFRPPPKPSTGGPVDDDLFAPMSAWNSGGNRTVNSPNRTYKFGAPGFTSVNSSSKPNMPATIPIGQQVNTVSVQHRPAAAPTIFSSAPAPFDPYRLPPSHNFIDLTKPQSRPKPFEVVDLEDYMDQDEANDKLKNLLEGNFGGDGIDDDDDDDEKAGKDVKAPATEVQAKLDLESKARQTDPAPAQTEKPDRAKDDGTRAGLKVKLLTHQIAGVKWMNQKETGGKKGRIGHARGGILADDMGLGKTLQTIATIVTNPRPAADSDEARKRSIKPTTSKATLIVVPLPLLQQWEGELDKFVDPSLDYKIHKHYGPKRHTTGGTMKKCDVVLTTYETLVSDYGNSNFSDGGNRVACFGVDWYRVVLDEAHRIKNPSTKQSKACCALKSHYRWCLTGTPMQNKLDEIQSLIRFLAIEPYNDMRHWKDQISNPMSRGKGGMAMKRVQVLLKAILLRRTKDLLRAKGELQTVGRSVVDVVAEFTPSERELYDGLEDRMANTIDRMGAKLNYANALVLLLRLRQACNHTELIKSELNKDRDALMTGSTSPSKAAATNQDVDNLAGMFGSLDVEEAGLGASNCQYCGHELETAEARRVKACEGCSGTSGALETRDSSSQKVIRAKKKLVRGRGDRRTTLGSDADASLIAAEEEEEKQHARINAKHSMRRILDSDEEDDGAGEWLVSGDEQVHHMMGKAGGTDDEDVEGGGESLGEEDSATDDSDAEPTRQRMTRGGRPMIDLESDDDESGPEFEDAHTTFSNKRKSIKGRPIPSGLESDNSSVEDSDSNADSESETSDDEVEIPSQIRSTPKKNGRSGALNNAALLYSAKIRELMKILSRESKEHKIIVFSSFVTMLRLIEPFLLDVGLRYVHYNGQMKNDEREASLESLRSNQRTRVLLCSLKSGALGLNLTAASRVVLIEPFWNPFVEEQAIDRVHRIGQKHDVVVYKLTVGGTVEQRIVALQEKKRELAKMALEAGHKTSGVGALNMQQVLALFKRDAEHTDQHDDDGDERFTDTRGSLLRKDKDSSRPESSGYRPRMTARPHRPGASKRVEDPVWGRR